jgi:hypothetical protein
MRKSLPIFLVVAAPLTLNGCVLPPVVTLASYTVDIVTYEATGKTATDHVYSAVARSDCSFVRVLHEKPICVDPPSPATEAVAATKTPQADGAGQTTPGIASVSTAQNQNVKVTIGSFLDQTNAERSVARYADWHPVITNVTVCGRPFHRVIASSLSYDEAAALKARIAADQPSRLRFAQSNIGPLAQEVR